ncbi:hypothetical protein CEP52_000062 [Fusarium oligoseptatum]|uniref:Uncharacterized protein n=1 Tax=Fusarium oligoseptatum TaxID=2604345 RepID=A0A428UQ92_9HYPO|nr:hypothetical protein CEP52_000062 [Fusarium oligoseptatum]
MSLIGNPRWSGTRIIIDAESGSACLKVDDRYELAETVSSLKFTTHFASARTQEERHEAVADDWLTFDDGANFDEDAESTTDKPSKFQEMMSPVLAYKEDGKFHENSARPGAFFVGYSMYNLTPVILRAAPAGTAPSIVSDDLSMGCQLEQVPGGCIDSTEVILTAPAAVPGNISAMKTALKADGNFCDAFEGCSARSIYRQLEASWTSLSKSRHPHVVQRTALFRSGIDGPRHALSVCQPKEPDGLLDPTRQQSVTNPPKSHMLPDAQLVLLKGSRRQPGFLYKAPYMANLLYPSLLLDELQQFSSAHPNDSLPMKSMLFAVQLWCDIKAHPRLQKEAFLVGGREIRDVSVDEFILGFEHWLRHHEEKQLLEYIHPFRFYKCLLPPGFAVG